MKRRQQGFTLLEIMLVVTIIALLMSVAVFKLKGNVDVAKMVAVESSLQSLKMQLNTYESMNGFPPTTEQGLTALVTQPQGEPRPGRWTQMLDSVPRDPWGKEFIYVSPGRKNPGSFDIYSSGPDRLPDTADDVWIGAH